MAQTRCRSIASIERLAVRSPAVLAHRRAREPLRPRRRAARDRSDVRAPRRAPPGVGRVVEQPLAAMFDQRRDAIDCAARRPAAPRPCTRRSSAATSRSRAPAGRCARDIERRDADVRRRQARGHRVVRHGAGEHHVRRCRRLRSLTAGSSGPSPTKTAPDVRPAAVVQARAARARDGSRRASGLNAPAKIATVAAGRANGSGARGPGRNRSVSAPHSSRDDLSRRRAGGRIAALGVTIRSARRQMRSRHRRIGSTSSARSISAFVDPG